MEARYPNISLVDASGINSFSGSPALAKYMVPVRTPLIGGRSVIGRRVWDVQCKVRVVVGPVGAEDFYALLPGGHARRPVEELVRLYLGLELDAEVRVLVEPDAVPWAVLDHDEDRGPRLGRNAWVRSHNFGRPVADPAFPVG